MKHSLAVLILSMLATTPTFAQDMDVDVDSGSNSESTSGAQTHTNVNNALTLQSNQLRETTTTLKAAPGHGMAATTNSFSSDYCGGTTQAGGSWLTGSLGFSKMSFDPNCQALRRSQSFGQQSTHFANLAQAIPRYRTVLEDRAVKLAIMSAWETCRSNEETAYHCEDFDLVLAPDTHQQDAPRSNEVQLQGELTYTYDNKGQPVALSIK